MLSVIVVDTEKFYPLLGGFLPRISARLTVVFTALLLMLGGGLKRDSPNDIQNILYVIHIIVCMIPLSI